MEKIVLVTGGFDPLHSGHLAYLKAAKKLGDKLFVGINSDDWLCRKKGKNFLPEHERPEILSAIRYVDGCILFNDQDDTAIEAIKNVQGRDGWLRGQTDIIAFERNNDFVLIKRNYLLGMCQVKCDLSKKVTNSKDALYKGYQREGRKDLISIIKMSDILELPHQRWKK